MISVSPRRMTCFMRRPPRPSRPFPADRGLDEARDESMAERVPVALVLDDHFVRRVPLGAVDVEGRDTALTEAVEELSIPARRVRVVRWPESERGRDEKSGTGSRD